MTSFPYPAVAILLAIEAGVTGYLLYRTQAFSSIYHILIVILGWILAWVVARFTVSTDFIRAVMPENFLFITACAIGGLIGGGVMFYLLRRASRDLRLSAE